jgi:hypothetical protein
MIDILATGPRATWSSWTDAFVERLRGLGWIDGRTVAFAYRWAEGRRARFTEFAAEFLGVDVILTSGAAGIDLKRTTSTIPIVLAVAQDPLGEALVMSFHDRAATSPAYRFRVPMLQASDSDFCERDLPRRIRGAGLGRTSIDQIKQALPIFAIERPIFRE